MSPALQRQRIRRLLAAESLTSAELAHHLGVSPRTALTRCQELRAKGRIVGGGRCGRIAVWSLPRVTRG